MNFEPSAVVRRTFEHAIAAHQRFIQEREASVMRAAEAIGHALSIGHKVLAFGNGGSAGDAEHLVAELVGRFERERPGLPALALTPDSSVLTAIANDYGYDLVFARQVRALGLKHDVAVGISTSGQSHNVVAGLSAAKEHGLTTIALTGRDGGPAGQIADVHINVAEQSTARAQEVHRTVLHAICALLDASLGAKMNER